MVLRYGALTLIAGALAIASGAGCKSGDGGSGGGGGSGGQAQSTPVILPPSSGGQSCQNGGTCTDQAAIDAYADCIVTTCDAEYKQCFGDQYMSGTFGGSCAELMDCASQCQDCDQTCLKACSDQHFTGACKDCIVGPITTCAINAITSGKCTVPCAPNIGGGGGKCDELQTCCNGLPADKQAECNTTLNQVKLGGDLACGSVLSTYQHGFRTGPSRRAASTVVQPFFPAAIQIGSVAAASTLTQLTTRIHRPPPQT